MTLPNLVHRSSHARESILKNHPAVEQPIAKTALSDRPLGDHSLYRCEPVSEPIQKTLQLLDISVRSRV
jgi:hypothetical protein